PCHALPHPLALDDAQRDALQAHLVATGDDAAAFLDAERDALAAMADGRPVAGPSASPSRVRRVLRANAARRRRLGHYLPAMWQYRGEWFWALDRLDFLGE